METTIFVELVNNVGFPFAICIALFWTNHENTKHQRKLMAEFKDAICANTTALQQLSERIK